MLTVVMHIKFELWSKVIGKKISRVFIELLNNTGKKLLITTVVKVRNCGVRDFLCKHSVYTLCLHKKSLTPTSNI